MRLVHLVGVLLLSCISSLEAQDDPVSVGIFIYDGVEVLDFTGPAEVFAATSGFEPFLVAITEDPVISQGFIKVIPQYSIKNCPPTDILVFPGGGTGKLRQNESFMEWVKSRSVDAGITMSVCTGAAVLSAAGLLDGKDVTTWYGFIERLQEMTPEANVLTDTRFVDNGTVLTTAGVSAGIDGALHIVSRISGENVARATAQYMEYDKWQPEDGKVYETVFIRGIRENGLEATLIDYDEKNEEPSYYFGEVRNLAFELIDADPDESESIFRWLLGSVPGSPDLYDGLGRAMLATGSRVPVSSDVFMTKLRSGEINAAKQLMQDAQATEPGWTLCTEAQMNLAGYHLLQNGQTESAIEVFRWNTERFPDSPNAWDSLADGLEAGGRLSEAVEASRECLARLQTSSDIQRSQAIETSARSRIERLSSGK